MGSDEAAAAGPADGQGAPSTAAAAASPVPPDQAWSTTSLQQLRVALQHFAAERDWGQYHTPRNLLLALVGEAGELAEIFQWRGEVACGLPGFTAEDRHHVGEELADVLLYLVRLADACHIDLAAAAQDKLRKNAAKYPAEACRGRSDKYTRYVRSDGGAAATAQQQQQPAAAAVQGEQAAATSSVCVNGDSA